MILETERLYLREMTEDDFPSLCLMLQDPEVMYAYAGPFNDEEAHQWLDKQLNNYLRDGFGLWAVILKETGEMIGQCGLTLQDCAGDEVLEVGYLLRKEFWHQGYATEAAQGCVEYAFITLFAPGVYSLVRDTNLPSQQVAKRLGMQEIGSIVKHYRGQEMPHLVFYLENEASPILDL